MKSKIESITPEKATEYLKRNKTNRPIRQAVVETYALDMRKGHWLQNHQGIAFDTDGNLIDGQHRLEAIRMSGVTVIIMVTWGVPPHSKNGMTIFTMDTVDRGKQRTIGDQLCLRHGCKSGALVAATLQVIGQIASNGNFCKLTVPAATAILELYRKEVEFVTQGRSYAVGMRSSVVIGSIAFALKSDREKIQEFYKLLVSGEGLFKTGPTCPIYTLRKHLERNNFAGHTQRWQMVCSVLNSAKHYVEGTALTFMKHTTLGVEYFINHQKSSVAKVTEIVTL